MHTLHIIVFFSRFVLACRFSSELCLKNQAYNGRIVTHVRMEKVIPNFRPPNCSHNDSNYY